MRAFSPAALLIAVALALAAQFWLATAGTWSLDLRDKEFRYTTGYYGQLAEAFRQGKPYLLAEPPPELARLADPYDPDARFGLGARFDASYFNGRYYLYFGPAPALVAIVIETITGQPVSDAVLTLLGSFLVTIGGTLAAWIVRRRLLPQSPEWPVLLTAPALALGHPIPFLLDQPAVYQAAVLQSQGWLMLGLSAALAALTAGRLGLERTPAPPQWLQLVAAGACLAFALACRLTVAGPIAVLALGTAWLWPRRSARQRLSALLAIGGPVTLSLLALAGYNLVRFGSVTETGHRFQLTGYPLFREYGQFFSVSYLLSSAYALFLQPLELLGRFPYITWLSREALVWPAWIQPPDALIVDPPVAGLVWVAPWIPLGILAGAAGLAWPGGKPLPAARWWLLLAGMAVAAIPPVLIQRYVIARYLADIAPLATVTAAIGFLLLLQRFPRWKAPILGLATIAALLTVLIGTGFAIQGRYRFWERHNPDLLQGLASDATWQRGGQRPLDGAEPLAVWSRAPAQFGNLARLVGYRFTPETVRSGETGRLILWWRPGPNAPGGHGLRVRVLDREFRTVAELQQPLLRPEDAAVWRPGGDVEDIRLVAIPGTVAAPDYLFAEVQIIDSQGQPLTIRDADNRPAGSALSIGPLRLRHEGAWPPDSSRPTDVRYESDLHLRGVRIDPPVIPAGRSATVSAILYWQAGYSGVLEGHDRQVRLEIVGREGAVVARQEGAPGDGRYRTGLWWPGERFADEHELELPERLSPGTYRLRVSVTERGRALSIRGNPDVGEFRVN